MELALSPEDAAFRDEVRAFIKDNYPAEMRVPNPETDLSKEQMLLWHRILHKKGWIAPLWPKEYGGPGWSITRRFIFEQETTRAGTMPPLAFSVTMVGPVIYTFGNAVQKQKFLPRILSGEDWWCQGYSEPGSGSDLATVRTKAVRDGDHYIVNGHKTWTTLAQHADWIFCLVRTDPTAKPQSGISFLLIDMKSPGITVRPIITIDGSHEVNDVFLEDVRVPVENLIGEENKGWTYAKFLLGNERTSMAGIGRSTRYISKLKQIVKAEISSRRSRACRICQGHRPRRARRAGAGGDRIAGRGTDGARDRSGTGGFAVQDPRHGDLSEHHRIDPPRDRQLRPCDSRASGERQPLHARAGLRPYRVREISEFTQAQHLRRIQRDPAQHHRKSGAWSLGNGRQGNRMDIQFTEEQELLRSSVQRLLRDQYDFEARRKIVTSEEGFEPQAMAVVRRLGLLGAPFAEHVGGLGGGPLSIMIIMQEFGRHLVVEPFVETVVLAGGLLEHTGSEEQKQGFVPDIIAGMKTWALAWTEKGFALRPRQRRGHGATRGQGLFAERRKDGGHRSTLGRLSHRLRSYFRSSPRSRRRQPVRGRSLCRQSRPAELQDHRRPARRRNQPAGRRRPDARQGRRGRRRAGGLP